MIDFHSHILPNMDDGSCSVSQSSEMLCESVRQKVTHIVATPHFYAHLTSLEEFLEKRQFAWNLLSQSLNTTGMPKIHLGAEVHYYEGISCSKDICSLCLVGTNLLLVEMPSVTWSMRMLQELAKLNGKQGVQVVLAHFERYLNYQSEETWDFLRQNEILLQANADFFLNRSSCGVAIQLLKNGNIHFLGSDCHNMSSRKPNLGLAVDLIIDKLGHDSLKTLNSYEREVFNEMV